MYLFVGISLITLLLSFCPVILKYIPIRSRFFKYEENRETLKEIETLKQELQRLEEADLPAYSKMVRKTRAENKISLLQQKLSNDKVYNNMKGYFGDLVLGYVVKGVLLIALAYISFKYRYTPLAVFDERFNFAPFSGLVMFPTGIPNSVSVPFWVLSCNLTFRWFRNLVKAA